MLDQGSNRTQPEHKILQLTHLEEVSGTSGLSHTKPPKVSEPKEPRVSEVNNLESKDLEAPAKRNPKQTEILEKNNPCQTRTLERSKAPKQPGALETDTRNNPKLWNRRIIAKPKPRKGPRKYPKASEHKDPDQSILVSKESKGTPPPIEPKHQAGRPPDNGTPQRFRMDPTKQLGTPGLLRPNLAVVRTGQSRIVKTLFQGQSPRLVIITTPPRHYRFWRPGPKLSPIK